MGFVFAECWRPAVAPAPAVPAGKYFVGRFHFLPHPWCCAATVTVELLAAAVELAVRAQHVENATLPPLALALQGMKPVACPRSSACRPRCWYPS